MSVIYPSLPYSRTLKPLHPKYLARNPNLPQQVLDLRLFPINNTAKEDQEHLSTLRKELESRSDYLRAQKQTEHQMQVERLVGPERDGMLEKPQVSWEWSMVRDLDGDNGTHEASERYYRCLFLEGVGSVVDKIRKLNRDLQEVRDNVVEMVTDLIMEATR